MRTLAHDLRYALRLLRRSPGFTAAAALVLALGIGANSAVFSVVDAALLRPLPFRQPEQLTALWEHPPGYDRNRVSPLNFLDWHDQNDVFTSLAAYAGGNRTLKTGSGVEQIPGQAVTSEFFDVFGLQPVAGRFFRADDLKGSARMVVLSERIWRERFGGDPKLVGRTLELDGDAYTVLGIVPGRFRMFWDADLWTLYVLRRSPEQRRMHYLGVIGRRKPGVSMERAQSAMDAIAAHIAEIAPDTNKGWGIKVEPLRESLVGRELRTTTLVLAAVVGFVLLMACANVANLMLARATRRAREMAVRVSLGAGQARIVRQLLTESLVLACLGGALALVLAWSMIRAAPALLPQGTLPLGLELELDWRVAGFAAAATLGSGLLFGLVPAWRVARASLAEALRGGGRGATASNSKLLSGLAMTEIAVAVMLVAGAGLFLRTLERLNAVDPGFHAGRVLTMHVILPFGRYDQQKAGVFYDRVQREVESAPGVVSASFGGSLPLTGWDIGQGFEVVGDPPVEESQRPAAHYQIVGARYFETLGIPLEAGRTFDARDTATSAPVAIVNHEFARRYLKNRQPVGARIRVQAMDSRGPVPVEREVVGVSGQVRVEGLGETENAVEVYVPITQNPWFGASLAVRTAGSPGAALAAAKQAIAHADREIAVTQVRTMDEITYRSAARPRFRARMLGGFALGALLLAGVGVFGVLAFSVTQRTREFGIRMALGARMGNVLRMVLLHGIRIAAGGVALGIAGAMALAGAAGALLFGVEPIDPVSFGSAAAVLALVAVAAAALPAWRASRVDPAITLREE